MKRTLIILAGMITILVIAYLAYDLTKGVISPCETIFEQSSVQIGAKLKLIESQGEVLIGKEKIQDLTETAQVTALNLKTCCIVLNAGNVDAKQFLMCKESAKQYETKVDTVIEQLKEAEVARKTGDRKLVEDQIRKINETLEEAKRVSEEFQRDIEAISAVSKGKGTQEGANRVPEDVQRDIETIPSVPKVKGTKRQSSEMIFQWDGVTQTYWKIYQKDAYGDYKKVADSDYLKKGQQSAVELAPGEYRVSMNWNHGFESKDVAVKAGETLSIHPAFGVVSFQWDGVTQTYWKIYQKDAYGDYKKVADSDYLKKGQQSAVELAPGEYWTQRAVDGALKAKVVIRAQETHYIMQ